MGGPPNRRPSPAQVEAGHREVARRWSRREKAARDGKSELPRGQRIATIRSREMRRIFDARYGLGGELPDDDAGLGDLELLVAVDAAAGKDVRAAIKTFAPWCSAAEADRLVWSAGAYPVFYTADEIAERLNLTYAERQMIGLTTIGAIDCDKIERERLRSERRNILKRQRRKAARKMKPRDAAVLSLIGDAEIGAADVAELARRHEAFTGVEAASLKMIVHRTIDRLAAAGLLTTRSETSPRGGQIRFVRRSEPKFLS